MHQTVWCLPASLMTVYHMDDACVVCNVMSFDNHDPWNAKECIDLLFLINSFFCQSQKDRSQISSFHNYFHFILFTFLAQTFNDGAHTVLAFLVTASNIWLSLLVTTSNIWLSLCVTTSSIFMSIWRLSCLYWKLWHLKCQLPFSHRSVF